MKRVSFFFLFFVSSMLCTFGQSKVDSQKYSAFLETQLACNSKPMAGKFLIELTKKKYISNPYVVSDTISYFKLKKPLKVFNFKPLAVLGFEEGYPKFFTRGPGTLPPEMLGIIVEGSIKSAKKKLKMLGMKNLEVMKSDYDLKGKINNSRNRLIEISCVEKY